MNLAWVWPALAVLGALMAINDARNSRATARRINEDILTDPALAAGFDRLRAAIRNEQHKGDQ